MEHYTALVSYNCQHQCPPPSTGVQSPPNITWGAPWSSQGYAACQQQQQHKTQRCATAAAEIESDIMKIQTQILMFDVLNVLTAHPIHCPDI